MVACSLQDPAQKPCSGLIKAQGATDKSGSSINLELSPGLPPSYIMYSANLLLPAQRRATSRLSGQAMAAALLEKKTKVGTELEARQKLVAEGFLLGRPPSPHSPLDRVLSNLTSSSSASSDSLFANVSEGEERRAELAAIEHALATAHLSVCGVWVSPPMGSPPPSYSSGQERFLAEVRRLDLTSAKPCSSTGQAKGRQPLTKSLSFGSGVACTALPRVQSFPSLILPLAAVEGAAPCEDEPWTSLLRAQLVETAAPILPGPCSKASQGFLEDVGAAVPDAAACGVGLMTVRTSPAAAMLEAVQEAEEEAG